jgi:hypothetical protein
VLLTGSRRLRILCVKLHIIIIVLVTVIAITRIKPLLLPKVRARIRQKLRQIVPART